MKTSIAVYDWMLRHVPQIIVFGGLLLLMGGCTPLI